MAIPADGRFSYRAAVNVGAPVDTVQARLQLFMPSGRLVYQKTFTKKVSATGPTVFVFERQIGDIGLKPAAYPTKLTVRAMSRKHADDAVIEGALLVYDPKRAPRRVSLVARVSALPLTDPEGHFVVDPSTYVRARDDVSLLTDYVLRDSDARLSLSVSPQMLQEWRQVAAGYRYESPEGPVEVSAAEEGPRTYAYALKRLADAAATGRLELLSCGYSDPDLSQLESDGLTRDIGPQYDMGISAVFASIGTTPSPGTAPAKGCFSGDTAAKLADAGISYAFVSERCVRKTSPGVYASRGSNLVVMVSAETSPSIQTTASVQAVAADVFGFYLDDAPGPIPLVVDVGPAGASADRVISTARVLAAQPWTSLATPGEAFATVGKPAQVSLERSPSRGPREYWNAVAEARKLSRAVVAALGLQDEEALLAEKDSLIAEASAWSGGSGDYTHSDRGLGFAAKAKSRALAILRLVSVKAQPVTLAGTRGKVPITIVNAGQKPLTVRVIATPSSGMKDGLARPMELALQPQDNFIQIPVDLQGGLSGTLNVKVVSADVEIAETDVRLSASVMDRLVILGAIAALLGGLLAFIITRVRRAERARNGASLSR
jgi:hypothetical protein